METHAGDNRFESYFTDPADFRKAILYLTDKSNLESSEYAHPDTPFRYVKNEQLLPEVASLGAPVRATSFGITCRGRRCPGESDKFPFLHRKEGQVLSERVILRKGPQGKCRIRQGFLLTRSAQFHTLKVFKMNPA